MQGCASTSTSMMSDPRSMDTEIDSQVTKEVEREIV